VPEVHRVRFPGEHDEENESTWLGLLDPGLLSPPFSSSWKAPQIVLRLAAKMRQRAECCRRICVEITLHILVRAIGLIDDKVAF
jgi:hypothetical protein